MCDLHTKSRRKQFTGYKVVAKHKETGNYYSIAMGFQYKIGKVPIVEEQKQIGNAFCNTILHPLHVGWRNEMMGRTAVFTKLYQACGKRNDIYGNMHNRDLDVYDIIIIKMTLRDSLMNGEYGWRDIVAGKEIVEMKEFKIPVRTSKYGDGYYILYNRNIID